jgi:hypothetical protein
MKIFYFFVFIITTKSFIIATNYYVSVSYGDDTNRGLSISAPLKLLKKRRKMASRTPTIVMMSIVIYKLREKRHYPYKADVGSSILSTPTAQKPSIILGDFCFTIGMTKVFNPI